jgi:hypothetical protein
VNKDAAKGKVPKVRIEVKEVRVAVKRGSTTARQAHLKNEGECCLRRERFEVCERKKEPRLERRKSMGLRSCTRVTGF